MMLLLNSVYGLIAK